MENELPAAAPFGGSHSNLIETLQSSLETPELTGEQHWLGQRAYGFSVAGFNFIVEQGLYCELLTDLSISALPNAPDHFIGLANVRGNLIPIYQLEPLIEGTKKNASVKTALMFDQPTRGAALVINDKPKPLEMTSLLPVENKSAVEALPPFLREAIIKTYNIDDQVWHSLKHTTLFQYLAQFI